MSLHRNGRGLVPLLREDAVGFARTAILANSGADPDRVSQWHYDGRVTGLCIALHYATGEEVTSLETAVRAEAQEEIDRINAGRQ